VHQGKWLVFGTQFAASWRACGEDTGRPRVHAFKGLSMNLVPTFSWFSALRLRWPRGACQPDFGDMGTAFGLEASLDSELSRPPQPPIKKGRPESGTPQWRLLREGSREAR
jgi:hypothetical protein